MRRSWRTTFLLATATLALAGRFAHSAQVTGDPADSELGGHDALGDGGSVSTGVITSAINNMDFRVGSGGTTTAPGNYNAVLVFNLPTRPVGEIFDTASLRINLSAKNGTLTGFNADLYAIGARTANTVLAPGDFYLGDFGDDDTSATPLHDDFLVSGTALGAVSSSGGVGAGADTLVNYLNNLYATDSAAADKFLFLRINPDADPIGTGNRFRITPANDATVANHPTLIYTTAVPEPGTAGVLFAAGLLAASRRRMRRN